MKVTKCTQNKLIKKKQFIYFLQYFFDEMFSNVHKFTVLESV